MIIDPLFDRVLLKRVQEKEETPGGIMLPEAAREKPMLADVIAVGKGGRDDSGKLIPPQVKVGDRVMIGRYAGTEIEIDEEKHVIVREEEILGIVREPGQTGGKEK